VVLCKKQLLSGAVFLGMQTPVCTGGKSGPASGLILTGNSFRGIGLNDCVAAANRAWEAVNHLLKR
jgi:hypothetical protein